MNMNQKQILAKKILDFIGHYAKIKYGLYCDEQSTLLHDQAELLANNHDIYELEHMELIFPEVYPKEARVEFDLFVEELESLKRKQCPRCLKQVYLHENNCTFCGHHFL